MKMSSTQFFGKQFIGNIELYEDEKLLKPLVKDSEGRPFLKIPIVNAGEELTMEFYIVNRSKHKFELEEVSNADADVMFKFDKEVLEKDNPVKVEVTFAPKPERASVLDAGFKIKGRFVVEDWV